MRQSKIKQYRASNYQGSDQEWQTLLEKLLVQGGKDASTQDIDASGIAPGVAIVADVKIGSRMTIIFHRHIGDITVFSRATT